MPGGALEHGGGAGLLVVTDNLTGLANRRELHAGLNDADMAMYAAKQEKPATVWRLHVPDPAPHLLVP